MNHKTITLISLMLISYLPLFSQTNSIISKIESRSQGDGKVMIIQNDSIETLLERHIWENSKEKGIMGYRLRIFSGSGQNAKSEFEETKARFISLYDVKVHEKWDYPFYKIYVGDFRTRSEAMKLLKQIEKSFPDAFIVYTKINYPNIDIDERRD